MVAPYFLSFWMEFLSFALKLTSQSVDMDHGSSLGSSAEGGEGLTKKQKAMSFAAGAAMSYYLSPLVVMYFAITDAGAQQAFGFLMGLFGLALAKEVCKEINDADLIGALKRRLFGGREK
ncbi:hypothetical protein [Pandoraea pulmonicola]|nr:hypothetical protein [Pandoraea pulmonicola]